MERHFDREVTKLKQELLALSGKVEKSVLLACQAFQEKDIELCRTVVRMDEEIDQAEVNLEENCLKILALHQPVAKDLRMVVAALKINSDMERIADLAVNFAARSKYILKNSEFNDYLDYTEMSGIVRSMLKDSIDSLVELDLELAKKVWKRDEEVDSLHKSNYQTIYKKIAENQMSAEMYVNQISLSRYLERIADFATNIAEDVIYLINGEIVRHQAERFLDEVPD